VVGAMEIEPRGEWLAVRRCCVTGPKKERQLHEETQ
jgi:hypothetical protein